MAQTKGKRKAHTWRSYSEEFKQISARTSLPRLVINGAEVDDAGVVCIAHLTNLQRLGLGATKVSGAGLAE